MKLSRQVIVWSVILYFALSIPVSLLHELGHVYACTAIGFDYKIWVDTTGGHTICFGRMQDSIAYNAMGGVFGLAGSAVIIMVWILAKRHYAILAVGLAYFVDQSAKIILEGLYTRTYESGAIDGYIPPCRSPRGSGSCCTLQGQKSRPRSPPATFKNGLQSS